MTEIQTRFSDIVKSESPHPDAKPLADVLNQEIQIRKAEVNKDGKYNTAYVFVGPSKDSGQWYYSTSGVIFDQVEKILPHLENGCVVAKPVHRKNYHTFE